MGRKKRYLIVLLVVLGIISAATTICAQYWKFPPLPEPHEFGNILINRTSEKNNMSPVPFSHWSHRTKYTCRVCHFELDFSFTANKTEITEEDNRNGLFCGACHDGKEVFGHTEGNCEKCHSSEARPSKEKFESLANTLPKNNYGNKIDWVKAISQGKISPKYSLYHEDERPLPFNKVLELESKWTMPVPPAYFPHATHTQWLDCANCHPDVFNVKKRTTKHFTMDYMLESKFCGVCHLKVAFPIDDCMGCHPEIKNQ